ncbi:MAG TPA: hypothetical protein VHA80_03805 [Solirubrobacterales bacterium]|nr:hypothetical protein [Solirubrobacterales bacterium]
MGGAGQESRGSLAARLRERLRELRSAVATRVRAFDDPARVPDPAYREGLEAALPAAVEHSLASLEGGERRPPEVPAEASGSGRGTGQGIADLPPRPPADDRAARGQKHGTGGP